MEFAQFREESAFRRFWMARPSHIGASRPGRESPMRRVVVTGLGVVAPNGVGREAFWSACLNGHSGVGPIRGPPLFPLWILRSLPNMVAAHISMALNAQGPNNTITTACAAGTQAVGEAQRLIQRDDADLVLAGGADSRIDPLMILAYAALGALSQSSRPAEEVSRPFDGKRDGFGLGEGAGGPVPEELGH